MANTVIGVFDNVREAENAAQELIYHGFSSSNVDISDTTETYSKRKPEHKEGLSRFFNNLFGDETDEARNYSAVAEKGCVVTVHAESAEDAEMAASILDQYGAVDANERGQYYRTHGSSTSGEPGMIEPTSDRIDRPVSSSDDISGTDIPVIEEEMQVGKREIEGDTVRIRSRVIERPVEENLRLRAEKIYVERKPVNRAATEADLSSFKEGTIEATEREEVPVVNKEARVVEEVKLKKQVEEKDKAIRGSIRKQDVDVDRKKKAKENKDINPDRENL